MRGKYSPTVGRAYKKDQEWFNKFCGLAPYGNVIYSPYDPEGFDSYGYDKHDMDRAGNHENDYMHNDACLGSDGDYNFAYDDAYDAWGFDGTKPVKL